MPIEFRCPHCHKLLRTQDGTGGKQAKCPSCAALVPIPESTAPPPLPADSARRPSPADKPPATKRPLAQPPAPTTAPPPTESGGLLSTAWENLRRKMGF